MDLALTPAPHLHQSYSIRGIQMQFTILPRTQLEGNPSSIPFIFQRINCVLEILLHMLSTVKLCGSMVVRGYLTISTQTLHVCHFLYHKFHTNSLYFLLSFCPDVMADLWSMRLGIRSAFIFIYISPFIIFMFLLYNFFSYSFSPPFFYMAIFTLFL